jgi:toxin ParE1/3/4
MTRLKIDRSAAAKRDLANIWEYIAPYSMKGASRTIREIYATFSLLADTPAVGRVRPDLGGELRSFPVAEYLILYRYSDTMLSIVRILHAARDITPDLLAE